MIYDIDIKDVCFNGQAALDLLTEHSDSYDVVILDYQISGGLMGEKLIRKIKEQDQFIQIIVITKMTINHYRLCFCKEFNAGRSFLVLYKISRKY